MPSMGTDSGFLHWKLGRKRGQAARLMFDIEVDDEGNLDVVGERMWVIVKEKVGDTYIGILDNQPACSDFEDGFYLCLGAEVPFLAEHIY
jgi:hypothetical protein